MHANLIAESTTAFEREIAALVVSVLNLEVAPERIDPEQPLYGEGLGLDSIDILEVALVIAKNFGIQIKADSERSEENFHIFASLRALAAYIDAHRTK